MGVNVGVSGQAGIFAASGKEELGTRVDGKGTDRVFKNILELYQND